MISRSCPPAWKTLSTSRCRPAGRAGAQVDPLGLRVDRRRLLAAGDLDQAQVGPVGVFACTPTAPTPAPSCAPPMSADRPPVGLDPPQARPRRRAVRRPARPLRHHPDRRRAGSARRFAGARSLRLESVVTVDRRGGRARLAETVNPNLPTGEIEFRACAVEVQSPRRAADAGRRRAGYPEEIRLVPLPRPAPRAMHRNIMLRSQVIASIRRRMIDQGFTEFQTPILTASARPEGARDYLVPSRCTRASSTRCRRRRRCSSSC
jgi:hypothetical protein